MSLREYRLYNGDWAAVRAMNIELYRLTMRWFALVLLLEGRISL